MVAVVPLFAWGVNRHVYRAAVLLHDLKSQVAGQPLPLGGGKFIRQGYLELAGYSRVLPGLGLLGRVPEFRPVGGPLWRTGRQDQLGTFDSASARVVVNLSGPLVGNFHPGTISSCSRRTAAS